MQNWRERIKWFGAGILFTIGVEFALEYWHTSQPRQLGFISLNAPIPPPQSPPGNYVSELQHIINNKQAHISVHEQGFPFGHWFPFRTSSVQTIPRAAHFKDQVITSLLQTFEAQENLITLLLCRRG